MNDTKETQVERLKNKELNKTKKLTLEESISKMVPELNKAMASPLLADRFARHILTVVKTNPALLTTDPGTFFGAMMMAATLNLMPNVANECWFIPFNNKKAGRTDCQFLIGYKGYIKMFYRSPLAKGVWHGVVYDKHDADNIYEFVKAHKGKEILDFKEKAPIGYYAAFELTTGHIDYIYLTEAGIQAIKQRSKAGDSGPWATDPIAMRIKTCYRHLMKYAPLETEMAAAVIKDEGAVHFSPGQDPREIFTMPDLLPPPTQINDEETGKEQEIPNVELPNAAGTGAEV